MRKSDVEHTKSISNAANNQAVSWTIGSKRNANWNAGCFAARRRARKRVQKHCLPASGHDRENARERVEVARVNDLGGGMGIAQRPSPGNVHPALFQKPRTIIAAPRSPVPD